MSTKTDLERAAEEYANKATKDIEDVYADDFNGADLFRHSRNGFKAGYAHATRWRDCKDEFPKIGQEIILAFPLPSGKYSWCAGEVDGSDDGLFVDFDLDGQEINTNCKWQPITLPTNTGSGE